MILEWFYTIAAAVISWFGSLLPDFDPPAELLNVDSSVNSLFTQFSGMGVWVDWNYIGLVAGIPASIWGGFLLFKLGRVAFAHVPFIGGKG